MNHKKCFSPRLGILVLFICICIFPALAQHKQQSIIEGTVKDIGEEPIAFASIFIKNTQISTQSDQDGKYSLPVSAGSYILCVQMLGYDDFEKKITVKANDKLPVDITLTGKSTHLDEVVVEAKSPVQAINESAYNAIALDTKKLHNTALGLSDALAKAPGIKIRESGGVGSDMRLMMDGFSGKHIKIFFDGVPQEGVGGSFGLNNIPINFAERIEVYRGVVPVGFGTDALAGIINIVTNKNKKKWFVDASYSYGSFNTHKSYINFGQTFKNGLTYEINAFQNYSDNSYYIDVAVEEFLGPNAEDGSKLSDKNIQHVQRFHDTYHNEAIIGKVGIIGKNWTDRLMLGFTYSHSYKEIQNGVEQKIVFGEKHRKGRSVMPSLEYRKRNLFADGLDVTLTANYNKNMSNNIDTASYKFNWRGEKQKMKTPGEQVYQDTRSDNNNWNGTFTANYQLGLAHTFTFNHVLSTFHRKNTGTSGSSGSSLSNAIPKENRKNISGLAYRLRPSEHWNISVFGKYYNQFSAGPVATTSSLDNYERSTKSVDAFGYGTSGTYYFLKTFQAKFSYEKAYRLPSDEEMFGDEDLEHGEFSLKPENSDNFNLSLSYNQRFGNHAIYIEGGLIYRNAKDYIQRTVSSNSISSKSYASYQNHAKVETKGYNISLHYSFADWVTVSGNFTQMDVRDNVKTVEEGSSQVNVTYGARMPNVPYLFANSDVTFYWRNLWKKGNTLTVAYDNLYQHNFPRHSEKMGDYNRDKSIVPTQFSHNLSIAYSLMNGRYNLSFECRNFTNEKLYDNFMLQKAGRAFYGKFRVYFGG